jgi:hypothetical protein
MHAITLTDGTTTVNLYNIPAGAFPTTWRLAAPEEAQPTIGEAIDLLVQASSVANLQTAVRQIETLLDDAVRRNRTKVGPRVFLTVQWDGEASAWRSEVLGGRLEMHGAPDQFSRLKVEATLGITRRAYWEGPETQLPLSNGNGTDNTAGLTIYNNGDASGTSPNVRNNWVQIDGSDVTGALPAPVKIELKNTTGSSRTWDIFHLANLALNSPSNFPHILEAEARVTGGTVGVNANASGGNQLQFSNYTSGQWATWDLSATLLQKTQGRWFRLLLVPRLRSALDAQAETVQAEIMDATGAFVLWSGPEVALPRLNLNSVVNLGAFPLPPGGYDASWGALKLRLTLRLANGTANTYLDFIQITPTDSYRALDMRPIAVANNALIVDNGYDALAYVETGGVRAPHVLPRGDPLMVWPGKLQRIYVLASYQDFYITDKWAARLWYRPRRVSI